jgi:hypothetical protein
VTDTSTPSSVTNDQQFEGSELASRNAGVEETLLFDPEHPFCD